MLFHEFSALSIFHRGHCPMVQNPCTDPEAVRCNASPFSQSPVVRSTPTHFSKVMNGRENSETNRLCSSDEEQWGAGENNTREMTGPLQTSSHMGLSRWVNEAEPKAESDWQTRNCRCWYYTSVGVTQHVRAAFLENMEKWQFGLRPFFRWSVQSQMGQGNVPGIWEVNVMKIPNSCGR